MDDLSYEIHEMLERIKRRSLLAVAWAASATTFVLLNWMI